MEERILRTNADANVGMGKGRGTHGITYTDNGWDCVAQDVECGTGLNGWEGCQVSR